MEFWNKNEETISVSKLKEKQVNNLRKMLFYIYDKVPFYKDALDEIGFNPNDFKSLDDLANLPFTLKQDLRDTYPTGLFAVGEEETVRIHASSGTTGKPTVVGYTKNDINLWSDLMARTLYSCGVRKNSTVQNSLGYGLFTGGIGFHYGAEKIGARVIPISGGNSEKQIMLMKDFKTNALITTPSYALHLAEVIEDMGIDPTTLSLESGILGAEPWSEEMKNTLEKKLDFKAYNSYGMSELMGPGVAIECKYQNGMHIWEDHFIAEVVDPKTLKPIPDGEVGELVITTPTKECLPLLRYRTRDLAIIDNTPCECGRTFRKLKRLVGRTDDMLIIRGVNVFPSQIETILLDTKGVAPHYELIISNDNTLTKLEVRVEIDPISFDESAKTLEEIKYNIMNKIKSIIGITVKVSLLEPKSIKRSEGKAVRIIDKRDENK